MRAGSYTKVTIKTDGTITDTGYIQPADLTVPLSTYTGQITAQNVTASNSLNVTSTNDVSLSAVNVPLMIGSTDLYNIAIDNNELQARNAGAASGFNINISGGNVGIGNASSVTQVNGVLKNGSAFVSGCVSGILTTTSGANATVTHGLGVTPTAVVATIRSSTYTLSTYTVFTGNYTATTFTIGANLNGANAAAAVSWVAMA